MANKWREKWKQWPILFSWAPKSLWTVTTMTKLKNACSLEDLDSILRKRDINLLTKVHITVMIFPLIVYVDVGP